MTLGRVLRRLACVAVWFAPHAASAASALLAVTGDSLPGSPAALLAGVDSAALNEAGEVVLRATLQQGVGGIDPSNDRVVWRIDGAQRELIAQSGASAPGGGVFGAFTAASIADGGAIALRGATASGATGLWRFPPSPAAPARVAATGVADVPEVPGAALETIGFALLQSPADVMIVNGRLAAGAGGVNSGNDVGVWLDAAGQRSLLAREQVTAAPGLGGVPFRSLAAQSVNNLAEAAVVGVLVDGVGGVTPATSVGVWRLGAGGGVLVARQGVGDVAGVPSASYSAFPEVSINHGGQIAFSATLNLGGAVTTANNVGVWLHDGASGELVARSGDAAPGAAGGVYASFQPPLLSDAAAVLLSAALVEGPGGVTAASAHGLWIVAEGESTLLARTGSGGVPGVAGVDFASFDALAFNATGVAAVQATLVGGQQGLWLLDAAGDDVLVARTGDVVAGRTIAALEFLAGSGGGDGRARALNDDSQLVYKATFSSGEEGLLLYSPVATADFTFDGAVDADDLIEWRFGFGQTSAASRGDGDADRDGDVDGNDLLLWQRQLAASGQLVALPEPLATALVLPALLMGVVRLMRPPRPS